GEFLEWANFNGYRYGTPWSSVREAGTHDRTVVLEIDVQGALQVREHRPDATLVFLQPPDVAALEQRMRARGEAPELIERRIAIGRHEMAQAHLFDHVVVNDRVDAAVAALERILDATSRPGSTSSARPDGD